MECVREPQDAQRERRGRLQSLGGAVHDHCRHPDRPARHLRRCHAGRGDGGQGVSSAARRCTQAGAGEPGPRDPGVAVRGARRACVRCRDGRCSHCIGDTQAMAQRRRCAHQEVPAEQRVDVTVDGKPFTTYIWPDTLEKPVLYPISTAGGIVVTRGFPPGARRAAGSSAPRRPVVQLRRRDGFDFWNNSDAIKPEQKVKMGSVKHRRCSRPKARATPSSGEGRLGVRRRQDVLEEDTTFTFRAAAGGVRMIDRVTTAAADGTARSSCPTTRKACSACA